MRFDSVDIFCHVIDNFGDAGVVYRFAKELKLHSPSIVVRVFIDDVKPLVLIIPGFSSDDTINGINGIEYHSYTEGNDCCFENIVPADVLVEAFACNIPESIMEKASERETVIINLEYISSEDWIEGYHLKESLLGRGKLRKFFYMPGMTGKSGGVIVDSHVENFKKQLPERRECFLRGFYERHDLDFPGIDTLFGTVFTYTRGFDGLFSCLRSIDRKVCLLVFGEKSSCGIKSTLERMNKGHVCSRVINVDNVTMIFMPFLFQKQYDELVCACDFNFVRGEDSWIRAVLSGKPFIWQAYIQENKYHIVKIKAFIDRFEQYFEDRHVFDGYSRMLMEYNNVEREDPCLNTVDDFSVFFGNLNKIASATAKMCYFIKLNSLVPGFVEFLSGL
jgi:uncharacterized repeat protein (TIGR03837 family)